jgi:hypothetical protein
MAIYILIRKLSEDSENAEYAFGLDESKLGTMKIEKNSGKITVTEEAPTDDGFISQRAGRRIFLHWRDGEFPEKTCWAS